MADPRFHRVAGPFTLAQLADIIEVSILPADDANQVFVDVAPLGSAEAETVSFLDNKRYVEAYKTSRAGACVVHPDYADSAPDGMALLLHEDPYRAYAKIATAFYPEESPRSMVAASANIHPTAKIGDHCTIEDGVVIGANTIIGDRCVIRANAVIGEGVKLGSDVRVGHHASLVFCIIGDRTVIHSGVRIGQDGFGFAMGPQGHYKVPQLGRVIIGCDVEIGANATVDRGAGPDTKIGDGTKIDNLVQIAHNVDIGRHCVIVSQVGISGSTKIGDFAVIAGQAGITGHLNIGMGAQIAAQSGVMRDVPAGAKVGGSPAQPARDWWRGVAAIEKLAKSKK